MTEAVLTALGEQLLAETVADQDKQARAFAKERDQGIARLYEAVTGQPMPQLITFRDQRGALWAINVYCRLQLVERGAPDHE